jgi:hypothetical protein
MLKTRIPTQSIFFIILYPPYQTLLALNSLSRTANNKTFVCAHANYLYSSQAPHPPSRAAQNLSKPGSQMIKLLFIPPNLLAPEDTPGLQSGDLAGSQQKSHETWRRHHFLITNFSHPRNVL